VKVKNLGEKQILAPCGINCSLCRAYQRKRNKCDGCYEVAGNRATHCESCKIKHCEDHHGKETELCIECEKFPCKKMKQIDLRYIRGYKVSLIQNQERLKKLGAEAYLEEEKKLWTCPNCGGTLCMHQTACLRCGVER